MQRILPRGEIEGLERTNLPNVYLPEIDSVFGPRAERLRQLAEQSPVADYLYLMAEVIDIQDQLLRESEPMPLPDTEQLELSGEHDLPPLASLMVQPDPLWKELLDQLLWRLQRVSQLPEATGVALAEIAEAASTHPEQLDRFAEALLRRELHADLNLAWAPFIMAALQVYFTGVAAQLDPELINEHAAFGSCPCCGSQPVASVVQARGPRAGRRYVICSLCATQWHIVRVTCSHCESTEKILYHAIEGGNEAIRAESCGQCGSYRKIFYQEKDSAVEALADDLGSLELDMLMAQEGFFRVNENPLLWLSHH